MIPLIITIILLPIVTYFVIKYWYHTYNKFQRLVTQAQNNHANIYTVMQKRLDNIYTLAQVVHSYHIHEYETIRDTIAQRGQENITHMGLNAVWERYPILKADSIFASLMDRDSKIEGDLMDTRLFYNRSVEKYNETLRIFPKNIIAKYHNFKELSYLSFPIDVFKPQSILQN